jgi:hypothetical protein
LISELQHTGLKPTLNNPPKAPGEESPSSSGFISFEDCHSAKLGVKGKQRNGIMGNVSVQRARKHFFADDELTTNQVGYIRN